VSSDIRADAWSSTFVEKYAPIRHANLSFGCDQLCVCLANVGRAPIGWGKPLRISVTFGLLVQSHSLPAMGPGFLPRSVLRKFSFCSILSAFQIGMVQRQ